MNILHGRLFMKGGNVIKFACNGKITVKYDEIGHRRTEIIKISGDFIEHAGIPEVMYVVPNEVQAVVIDKRIPKDDSH